jgi:hypothetical protein
VLWCSSAFSLLSSQRLLSAQDDTPYLAAGSYLPMSVAVRQLPAAACREEQVIILRPPDFQDHSAKFIIRYNTAAAAAATAATGFGQHASYTCWLVPHHLSSSLQHWWQLLTQPQLQQQLVLMQPGSRVMHVLSKFELLQFVHVFAPAESGSSSSKVQAVRAGTCFELPRFGLEFELQQDGKLASKGLRGYELAEQQQLVSQHEAHRCEAAAAQQHAACNYTLPDFTQYLVLQRKCGDSSSSSSAVMLPGSGRSSTLVLVPAAGVVRSGGSSSSGYAAERIDITLDGASNADLKVSQTCLPISR